jgi:hypothetical protein
MFYGVLASILRLMEFVYLPAAHILVKLTKEVTKVPINQGDPSAANTRGATPRKDQVQVADKGKSKKMDKGKGNMIELEKPRKAAPLPLQTGEAFKIDEPKAPIPPESSTTPLAKKSSALMKKPVELPS